MTKIIRSPSAFVVLAFLYPAVFLLERNSYIYTRAQVVTTLAVVSVIAGCVAVVAWLLSRAAASLFRIAVVRTFPAAQAGLAGHRIERALLAGLGMAILLILLASPIEALVRDRALLLRGYVLLPIGVAALGYFFDVQMLNTALAGLMLFNGGLAIWHGSQMATADSAAMRVAGASQTPRLFQSRPNVYFVVLESYHSFAVRKEQYGIDNTFLARALDEQGFTRYDGTYSNYFATLLTVSSVMLLDHHYCRDYLGIADGGTYRKIIGGVLGNPVLDAFADNGYSIDYSRFDPRFYHAGPKLDRYESPPLLQPLELFRGVSWLCRRLPMRFRALCGASMPPAKAFSGEMPEAPKMAGAGAAASHGGPTGDRPVFSLIYAGAGHTPIDAANYPPAMQALQGFERMPLWQANAKDNYWISTYGRLVAKSDAALVDLVRYLGRDDPAAVVILMGDHGAWFHRNQWFGRNADPNLNMLENGVSPREVTRDLFEVFLAVKLPGRTPLEHVSPVSLFRGIFARLSGEEGVLGHRAADDSFAWVASSDAFWATPRLYRTVKDGRVLERWEAYEAPPSKR